MYDDGDLWPFKCPECGEEFAREIGWVKSQRPIIEIKCPGILNPVGPIPCSRTLNYRATEFRLILGQAKAGRYDPFEQKWTRKERPLVRIAI